MPAVVVRLAEEAGLVPPARAPLLEVACDNMWRSVSDIADTQASQLRHFAAHGGRVG